MVTRGLALGAAGVEALVEPPMVQRCSAVVVYDLKSEVGLAASVVGDTAIQPAVARVPPVDTKYGMFGYSSATIAVLVVSL